LPTLCGPRLGPLRRFLSLGDRHSGHCAGFFEYPA
jgi:hypothetical protein